MDFLNVIKEKCIGDGTCAAVCPIRIITMDPSSKLPTLVEGGDKACINCGHCVSVCSTGALSLRSMPSSECAELSKNWRVSPENLTELLKGRRSIRAYKEDAVDRALIEKIIDTARYAPSGINRQPVNWAIIYDTERVKELLSIVIDWMRALVKESSPLAGALHMDNIIKNYDKGEDPITRGAPHLVVTYSLKEDMTAPAACTIALAYFDLIAASYGLGSCWAGYVHMALNMSPEAQKFIGLSKKTNVFGAMMLGYQKFDYSRIPSRNKPHIIWR